MRLLQKIRARLLYLPSILVHRMMCVLGVWRKWDWVGESILLGGAPTSREARRLAAMGVDAAISVCEPYEMGRRAVIRAGIQCLSIPVIDYTYPTESDVTRGAEFIQQQIAAGKKVFVFCKAGRVRSATVVFGYLIMYQKRKASEAGLIIRTARPQVSRRLLNAPCIVSILNRIDATDPAPSHHV